MDSTNSDRPQDAIRRPRRRHSAALKAEVVAACTQPGASVARVALAYGINANLPHRWRKRAEGNERSEGGKASLAEFVPVTLSAVPVVAALEDIRIELRRGSSTVSIAWPTSAAAVCASPRGDTALEASDWGQKYPTVIATWRRA